MSYPDFPAPPPDVPPRYSMRTLLIAMTAVAVAAAVAGPIYRRTPAESRDELAVMWLSALAVAGLISWYRWRARARASAAAGRVRFALPTDERLTPWRVAVATLWWSVALWAGAMFVEISLHAASGNWLGPLATGAVLSAVLCGTLRKVARTLFRRRAIKLCDHGFVADDRLLPWGSVRRCSWSRLAQDVLHLSTRGHHYTAKVPPEQRMAIEGFVREKTTVEGDAAWETFEDELPAPSPISR